MIMLCNRRGPTIDNVVTIYIECIWIICHGTVIIKSITPEILVDELLEMWPKYKELLDLPLGIAYHTASRTAICHDDPDRDMRTG
ncbi:hypothetical protein MCOR02_003719 [Pyricularia oryzae]|uniref:Uncharacterized protein n=1 Tax=Pyricularia grisea TaxID=148305 RepID=A0ABQ8NDU5_PYRGI|nr:hypothetical protein MCOR02_003719 [Pyricularia oryzae]KAI6295442.1 hypothetical protein MCOR33_007653 [Pyricularia grisea]KAI6257787.1 hypothetical protein MCOR19_005807 [Pyricularia oryzae]KAI6334139.1 hypothetical protein MCOR30_004077 [Pyricularia oryzae]KAI6358162.1 hypothetical protein MCOR31_009974 [Pyricularia oryzae]